MSEISTKKLCHTGKFGQKDPKLSKKPLKRKVFKEDKPYKSCKQTIDERGTLILCAFNLKNEAP